MGPVLILISIIGIIWAVGQWSAKHIDKELKKNPEKYKKECINQAKKFDVSVFTEKIKEGIKI